MTVDAPLDADQFIDLLTRSGLAERRPVEDRECIEGMVRHADLMVGAWDGDCLIGVARSVTDFHYVCYISDLAVDAEYQQRGVGTALIQRTQDALGPRCKLLLLSAPAAAEYYSRLGFVRNDQCWELAPGQRIGEGKGAR